MADRICRDGVAVDRCALEAQIAAATRDFTRREYPQIDGIARG
jgi:hypothetical protein